MSRETGGGVRFAYITSKKGLYDNFFILQLHLDTLGDKPVKKIVLIGLLLADNTVVLYIF